MQSLGNVLGVPTGVRLLPRAMAAVSQALVPFELFVWGLGGGAVSCPFSFCLFTWSSMFNLISMCLRETQL